MFNKLCEKILPIYIHLWPTSYWLAIWSAFSKNESARKALRITIRQGKYHSKLIFLIHPIPSFLHTLI